MILSSALASLLLLIASNTVNAAPNAGAKRAPEPLTVPLVRRGNGLPNHTPEEWGALAEARKAKYQGGPSSAGKRALVTVSTTNAQADTSYFASIDVGTPPRPFTVVLDTGSADLWLSSNECIRCASQVTGALFNPDQSSTFRTAAGSLDVTYGSGQASGDLGTDVVTLGGFQVSNQLFGVATSVSNNFLSGNLSGLMGLGFESLASTRGTPWWENASTSWTNPQMSFYMTRFRNTQFASNDDEPGGQFTMGGTNSSLYNGEINYINLVRATYWTIPLTGLGLEGGSTIQMSGSEANAAIDTGTTLIGGPSSILDQFYAQLDGAQRGTGNLQNYYTIPCDSNLQAELTFGGQTYSMQASDLIGGTVTNGLCIGAFFILDFNSPSVPIPGASSGVPSWVVGSAFLKNVYTVFQSEPAAVGFGLLKDNVQEFGVLGPAGFSIDEHGNSNGTLIPSAAERTATIWIPGRITGAALIGLGGALFAGISIW